jgi:uncharacterized SAM-binding protein YcdF (DUF218 family)
MRRWLITAGILTVVAVAGIIVFLTIGGWLVVQDPLVHADVIVVLSGHLPDRALEAAQLYHAGYAEQVWISLPTSPAEELKTMNIYFLGEDFYNAKVLLARGVPVDAIRIMEHPSANTQQEVVRISEAMRQNNFHTAIVITAKPQSRRARAIWHKLAGSDLRGIVRFANGDPYDGAHWWRHTHDALDIVREVLGLLNVWGGFPLRASES